MRASSFLSFASVLLFAGCATTGKKGNVVQETPQTQDTAKVETPVATPAPTPKKSLEQGQYTIKSHDTLWDISSGKAAYEDPYYWPALFRANRDVIEDPDLIYVNEQIKIPKGLSDTDMEDARRRAKKAPAFEPHASPKPREQLEYLLD